MQYSYIVGHINGYIYYRFNDDGEPVDTVWSFHILIQAIEGKL